MRQHPRLLAIVCVASGALTLGIAPPQVFSQVPGSQAAPAELGRLFLTPTQRQELDRRRLLNIQEATVSGQDLISITGQISRSSGRSTTWINGVPQDDAYRDPRDPARVTLPGGEGESGVDLRVGQTIDRSRGVVTDGLAGGEVQIRKSAPATPPGGSRR